MAISRIESNSIAPSQTLTTPIIATTMGIGGATPAGSGSGITFPAAQSASSDANTLDDYEEGTWSPNVGGNATYSDQKGTYTRVGRMVTCSFDFTIATIGTGSTNILSGFPFTNAQAAPIPGYIAYYTGLTVSPIFISFYLSTSTNTAFFTWNTAGASTIGNNGTALFQSSSRIIGALTYPAV